jgi:2-keto-3-deoxy-L-rhamnonate aldolase RhmA
MESSVLRHQLGVLVSLSSLAIAKTLERAGIGLLFLDLEHGQLQYQDCYAIAAATNCVTLIRLEEATPRAALKACDTGVTGIVVPHTCSVSQIRAIIDSVTYPPVGARSVGLTANISFGADLAEALAGRMNPLVVAQIEDADGITAVEQIAAEAGVAGLFVGPYDLSASLGCPGDTTAPLFVDALDRVVLAAREASKPSGIYCPTVEAWLAYRERGFDFGIIGSDTSLLLTGARSVVDSSQRQ